MTGNVSPTTAVRNRISTDATVLPFAIPHDERHFTSNLLSIAAFSHLTAQDIDLMTEFFG